MDQITDHRTAHYAGAAFRCFTMGKNFSQSDSCFDETGGDCLRGRHEKPAGLARICGWGLCILLVFAILGTVLSALMAQMMSDQALHKRIAMDERVQAEEMSHIRTKAEEIAEANHFDASLIYDRITNDFTRFAIVIT